MNRKLKLAIYTLVGITVGAGVLGLPKAASYVGFFPFIVLLAILGSIMSYLNYISGIMAYGEEKGKQFPSLIEKYLGKKGKYFTIFTLMVSTYGAVTAYFVGISDAISILTGLPFEFSLFILVIFSFITIYKGFKLVEEFESIFTVFKIIVFLMLIVLLVPFIKLENLTYYDFSKLYIPYGVLLFAFMGYTSMPEIRRFLDKKDIKKVVIYSFLIIFIMYSGWIFAFVGNFGKNVNDVATLSLPNELSSIGAILTILLMLTPLLILSLILRDSFKHDLGIDSYKSTIFTLIVPVLLILLGHTGFFFMLEVTGVYSISLLSAITTICYAKHINKKYPYLLTIFFLTMIPIETILIFG